VKPTVCPREAACDRGAFTFRRASSHGRCHHLPAKRSIRLPAETHRTDQRSGGAAIRQQLKSDSIRQSGILQHGCAVVSLTGELHSGSEEISVRPTELSSARITKTQSLDDGGLLSRSTAVVKKTAMGRRKLCYVVANCHDVSVKSEAVVRQAIWSHGGHRGVVGKFGNHRRDRRDRRSTSSFPELGVGRRSPGLAGAALPWSPPRWSAWPRSPARKGVKALISSSARPVAKASTSSRKPARPCSGSWSDHRDQRRGPHIAASAGYQPPDCNQVNLAVQPNGSGNPANAAMAEQSTARSTDSSSKPSSRALIKPLRSGARAATRGPRRRHPHAIRPYAHPGRGQAAA